MNHAAVRGDVHHPCDAPVQKKSQDRRSTPGLGHANQAQPDTPPRTAAGLGEQRHATLLALWLLAGGWRAPLEALDVWQLRRRCAYAGLTMGPGGRPLKYLRRAELLTLLRRQQEVARG